MALSLYSQNEILENIINQPFDVDKLVSKDPLKQVFLLIFFIKICSRQEFNANFKNSFCLGSN